MKSFISTDEFERTKNADHILEMAGLGLVFDYRLFNHIFIIVKID